MSQYLRFIVISPAFGILSYMLSYYSQIGELPSLQKEFIPYITSATFGLLAGFSAMGIGKLLNKFVSWKKKHSFRFLLQCLALFLAGCILIVCYLELFDMMLGTKMTYEKFWLEYKDQFLKTLLILFIFVFIYTILDFMIYSFNYLKREEIQSVEMINNQMNLQFKALKSQLNPHFLFNSLNTISSLLYKDPEKAEEFIRKFAESYRFILDQNDKALIPLEKELAFVKAYNYILRMRFQDSYKLSVDLPEIVRNSFVPPLSIQMLVENAIKHNLISKNSPLEIKLKCKDNYLHVSNNINPLRKQAESFQIGIENIKKRYAFFTNDNIILEKTDFFTVSLPLITENNRRLN
ncbi:sensor histidine kinase [Ancylomarina sp.]|uniref:sensor histidine kinase n=1 Tax=Ancylomarina sp. TaxID=1970196 RepID=UPI00356A5749